MKRTMRLALGLTIALALVGTAAACGGDDDDSTAAGSTSSTTAAATAKPAVSIGAQDFGESAILAEIYKQGLAAKGFDASIQKLGGFRDLEVPAF
ncbi:MAG: hypothetical protein V7636_91, partial [Actinomycetota bacterium]